MNLGWNAYLLICSAGLIISVVIANPKRILNPFHFGAGFLGLMYITYVIRPYLSYTIGYGMTFLDLYLPGTSELVSQDVGILSVAFVLSVIFFAIGYRIIKRPFLDRSLIKQLANYGADTNKFRDVSVGLIIIGYASFLFAQRGGLFTQGTVEYARYAGGVVFVNTTGYVEYANYLVVSGTILYFASTKRLWLSIMLATPWLLNQIYSGWQRYMFLNLAIGLAIVAISYHLGSGRTVKRQTSIAIFLAIFALFLLVSMRGQRHFVQQGSSFAELVRRAGSMPVDSMLGDFSGFEGTWYTIHTIDSVKPFYGASIFYRNFVLPIPRILWPDKPLKAEFTWDSLFYGVDYSFRWRGGLTNASDYVWYNTAVRGAIGYAIEEWGWLGIPITFFFTGIFFAYIERRFAVSDFSPAWIATYGATFGLLTMQGRNDLFEYLLVYTLIFFIPYAIIQKWSLSESKAKARREFLSTIQLQKGQNRNRQSLTLRNKYL